MRTLIFIGSIFTIATVIPALNDESEEYNITFNAIGAMQTAQTNSDWRHECYEEYTGLIENTDEIEEQDALELADISSLLRRGYELCLTELHLRTLPNLVKVGMEVIYIPNKVVLPYEIIKMATFPEASETKRCSDVIKPLLSTCPNLLSPYLGTSISTKPTA
ncbi:MAG: hypothetical protein CML20_18685 [Rheinheimera sp.]|nr:hypothetical protein [Rheinheimera sp.]